MHSHACTPSRPALPRRYKNVRRVGPNQFEARLPPRREGGAAAPAAPRSASAPALAALPGAAAAGAYASLEQVQQLQMQQLYQMQLQQVYDGGQVAAPGALLHPEQYEAVLPIVGGPLAPLGFGEAGMELDGLGGVQQQQPEADADSFGDFLSP